MENTLKCAGRNYFLNNKQLFADRSQTVINHSPDGFNHGYSGSGAAQLALGVLLELKSLEEARSNYQNFKNEVIAKLPHGDFETTFII